MKKKLQFSISLMMLFLVLNFATPVVAQDPPPPPPPSHGAGGNVPGGGAPIGEGLVILVALGAAYGWKRFKSVKEE